MKEHETSDNAHRGGLTHSAVDAIVAVVLMIVGAVVMYSNYKLGAGWAADGPQSGYFPFYIGVFIFVACAVTLYQSLLGRHRNTEVFVEWEQLKRVLKVLIPTMVYVLGVQLVGIYVSSTIFIGAFMLVMGKYGWGKTLLVSVGVSAVFFWLFEVQFLIPLPKGPLEAMFGY